uniref:Transcription factor A, mitochondrial n=1 Tax=Leptobrachium leishanense TaxID=445787 RepID=A0A8C5MI28_9ANUR
MVSVLSRGLGLLVKSLAGFSFAPSTRCSNLLYGASAVQCSASRWFSKSLNADDLPKRPLASYMRYSVQQQKVLSKKYPEVKITELSKMISQEWKGLPDSAKEPYIAASKAEQLVYHEEMKKYKAKFTKLELEAMRTERLRKLRKRRSIRRKRELSLLGKPKRPRSAFNIFMSEHFTETQGGSTASKFKSLHADWIKLNASQQQAYKQLAEDDRIRYENEMKSWEEHMIEIGREDLVRVKKRPRSVKLRRGRSTAEAPKSKILTKTKEPAKFKEGKKASSRTLQNEE